MQKEEVQQPNQGWFQTVYLLIFFAVIGSLSIFGVFHYALDFAAAHTAGSWPTVEGIVTKSDPVRGCGRGAAYYPVVTYSYPINGTIVSSNRVAFGNACGSFSDTREVTKNYKVGATVSIHVNPSDSTDSVLIAQAVLPDTRGLLLLASAGALVSGWFVWAIICRPSLVFRTAPTQSHSVRRKRE